MKTIERGLIIPISAYNEASRCIMIENKIQFGGWTKRSWRAIRQQIKKWWIDDLNAIGPKRKRRKKVV